MKRPPTHPRAALLVLILAAISSTTVAAQTVSYVVNWFSVESGGSIINGGRYVLSSAIGQADAGTMSNGQYEIVGGFLNAAVFYQSVFLPLVLR